MKIKLLATLAVATILSAPYAASAAPVGQIPTSAEPGRLQDKFSREKPELQIDNKALIKDEEDRTNIKDAEKISFTLAAVTIEGNSVFDKAELEKLYADKIGQKVTLAEMYGVRDAITKYYRDNGYILSRAIVPPQEMGERKANFKFRIIEGRLNKVTVEGEFKGDQDILDNYLAKLRAEGPLNSSNLERYLLLINDLAGTTANATLKPAEGAGAGASDLVISIGHKYYNGMIGVDNSGTKFLGRTLISAQASANSVLGLSEKITARGIVSPDVNEIKFGDIAYQMPIGYEGTRFKALAGTTVTRPGATLSSLDIEGETQLVELTVTHPFLRSRKENLSGRVIASYKNTDSDIAGFDFYEDRTRSLTLGGTYDLADTLGGINLINLSGTQGFDVLNASDFRDGKSRINGGPAFTKFNLDASRLQTISGPFGVLLAASGQYSLSPLLAGEEFGVGGTDFGRGYDFSEVTGDSGIIAKIELQYGFDVGSEVLSDLQLYTFYDVGNVWQRDPQPGEKYTEGLASAGLGSRFNVLDAVSGYVELARPLNRDVASENEQATQVNFGLNYLF